MGKSKDKDSKSNKGSAKSKGKTLLPEGLEDAPDIAPPMLADFDEDFDTQTIEVTGEAAARLAAAYKDVIDADEDDWAAPTPSKGGQTLMPKELADALTTLHPESAKALMEEFDKPVAPDDFGGGNATLLPATPEVLRTLLGELNPNDATLIPASGSPSMVRNPSMVDGASLVEHPSMVDGHSIIDRHSIMGNPSIIWDDITDEHALPEQMPRDQPIPGQQRPTPSPSEQATLHEGSFVDPVAPTDPDIDVEQVMEGEEIPDIDEMDDDLPAWADLDGDDDEEHDDGTFIFEEDRQETAEVTEEAPKAKKKKKKKKKNKGHNKGPTLHDAMIDAAAAETNSPKDKEKKGPKTVYGFDAFDDDFGEYVEEDEDLEMGQGGGLKPDRPTGHGANERPPDNAPPVDVNAPTMVWINRSGGVAGVDEQPGVPGSQGSHGAHSGASQQRFVDLGVIGVGGMGEVRRVFERSFKRVLAMKILRQEIMHNEAIVSRFVAEAQATAQLQHPGIVPVHEVGRLSDGRYYFTMSEVRGRDLGKFIADYHKLRRAGHPDTKRTLRRLVDSFLTVCETAGYAHSRSVIHRDLKPENILIGEFGQVLVVDWGIAKVMHAPPEAADEMEGSDIITSRSKDSAQKTVYGSVAGTPAYMPIEQAAGDRDKQGPHSDVYALGAILYEILGGRPPYHKFRGSAVLKQLLKGPPDALPSGPSIPEGLRAICLRAMARKPRSRYPTARQLAEVVSNWLDGAQRREEALEFLNRAINKSGELDKLRERAALLRNEAVDQLADTPGFAEIAEKAPAWRVMEHAEQLDRGSQLLEVNLIHHARAALERYPELEEAHDLLSNIYKRRVMEAEGRGGWRAAERDLILLRNHHRGKMSDFLVGDGAVTLVTNPPGAKVQIYQYVERGRLMHLEPFGKPLETPIEQFTLPMGSYLLQITKDGHEPVRYPVFIGRQEHWDGVPPGGSEAHPIYLPTEGELFVGDCYVPAGYFWAGGDTDAPNAIPRTRVWVDAYVMQGIPVRNSNYVEFLEDLVKYRRDDEALNYAPARVRSRATRDTMVSYMRDRHGTWRLPTAADGTVIGADIPVMNIDWESAMAYSRWLAEEDALPWRLPHELEWEKCARGVDGRGFPMGKFLDPTWACMGESHAAQVSPATIFDFPQDESPYGARGMAGNVRDWCWNQYDTRDLDVSGGRLDAERIRPQPDGPVYRATRGGAWGTTSDECRSGARSRRLQSDHPHDVGIRLVRSIKK